MSPKLGGVTDKVSQMDEILNDDVHQLPALGQPDIKMTTNLLTTSSECIDMEDFKCPRCKKDRGCYTNGRIAEDSNFWTIHCHNKDCQYFDETVD